MQQFEGKDLKTKAREAMKRMKSGFWQRHREEVARMAEKAKADGVKPSSVVEFYEAKTSQITTKKSQNDNFYEKVKKLLDECGEVSDAIGRLIDEEYYNGLDYEAKQRYILELSRKYREAVEKYKREKTMI